jgi:hypothetical protein
LEWKVYNPEGEIKKYGLRAVEEAIERTKFKKPRIPGAYYKIVMRNMV